MIEEHVLVNRSKTSFDTDGLKSAFGGVIISNNWYDLKLAEQRIQEGQVDLVAFGRPFISNPDLVSRLKAGTPITPWDETTFYDGGSKGYTDYPTASSKLSQA